MMLVVYLVTFLFTLLLCGFLTYFVRNWALALRWVSHPTSGRHVHTRAIPRLGGIAIYLSVWLAVAFSIALQRIAHAEGVPLLTIAALFVPSTIVFLLGLIDDFHPLAPKFKLFVQLLAATLLYCSGFRISHLQLFFGHSAILPALSFALTVFWVLLITNAFNLIDGLDGLASGSAFFSTLVVFFFSLVNGHHVNSIFTIGIAGAVLGFLRFNFSPATIFLGDCGSLFIGFLLSALALAGSEKAPTMVAVAVPVVAFGLPIVDVGLSVVRRFMSRRPLFSADGEHIHHRLLKRGLTHRNAVYVLYAVSAGFALVSVIIVMPAGRVMGLALFIVSVAVMMGIQQLRYHELDELGRVARRTISQRTIIANNMRIRRTTEALNTCSSESFCRLLAEALEPIGFDALSLDIKLNGSIPAPLRPSRGNRELWVQLSEREGEDFVWSVLLTLTSTTGQQCGCLCLHRRSAEQPLKMDVNLLSSGFTTAVSDALSRLVKEEQVTKSASPWLSVAATAAGDAENLG